MSSPSVLVLGGGLSGMAAALTLARAGWRDITVIERGDELGGLAGSFEREGRVYPLAYHHILHRDRTLLYFLDAIEALPAVRWRKIRMLFRVGGRLYNLGSPVDFLAFPMSLADKLRFVRLMLKSFRKSDWSDWREKDAAELLDSWAGPGVRRVIFEPLCRLKFDLPCEQTSAAWLGARLHFREGSAPLGYIPGHNWTTLLCEGLASQLRSLDVRLLTGTTIESLSDADDRITSVTIAGGERLDAELVVSALPTDIYSAMAPRDATRGLTDIRYTAVISAICAVEQDIEPDFYWMNLASLDCNASGLFRLDALNPSLGRESEGCLNFVNHVQSSSRDYFRRADDELMAGYIDDFEKIFGGELRPKWSRVSRIPRYSPIFVPGYRNPAVRSSTFENVYFAGNYRTFPSIASTGTALWSGVEAGDNILRERGSPSDLLREIAAFRLRSMPAEG
jgi:protoporphyrinogen oxidase